MGRLQGKVALITGGGGGIGTATAMLFAEEGAGMAVVDRDGAAADAAAADIRGRLPSADVMPMAADLSDEAQTKRAVDAAAAYFGGLDILVNVAGIRVYGALADAEPDSWDSILAVNLMATVHCCKAAIPLLRSRGGGSIVNVSSVFGVTGRAGMGQYDVTKAAVVSLSRTLAIEEVGNGIRVNAVCPGPTITPFHIQRAKERGVSEEELRRTGAQHTLMKRWAEPREVAHTILFLACDESSFVTGTALVVDGGASAASA
ncbi:MAG: SDR family NAD(P)-dependent oxidoreductase [Deltaproteobacteria bacterium]|nr:SDR family NAD(P)-dependent oxidoreductase [Deltaproteobacteria bacterium]